MFSSVINFLMVIGTIKAILIGAGVIFWCGSIAIWIMTYIKFEYNRVQTFATILCFLLPILGICTIVAYNVPYMDPNMQIARIVAEKLDDYADKHPESIYNSEVILGEVDIAAKGVAQSLGGIAANLPDAVQKFASGGLNAIIQKKPEDMTKEELLELVKNKK